MTVVASSTRLRGASPGATSALPAVRSAYQPIVDLYSRDVVGFEALARGPEGSALESPLELFSHARERGLELDLDVACRQAAMRGRLAAGLPNEVALFVNAEPRVLGGGAGSDLARLTADPRVRFPVFVELTERSLTENPAELLRIAAALRGLGVGIALDDVGADARSLALMPMLAPDVIKLDLSLVQEHPSPALAEIVHAVNAEAERTGAHVLAEGIETEAHLQTALALGARYGQGWFFGRPGPLPAALLPPSASISRPGGEIAVAEETPFEVVAAERELRRGSKGLLLALSLQIEAQARKLGRSSLVLATFQEAGFFTPASAARYVGLAERSALVCALAVGLSAAPAPGVRGVALDEADPLRGEWDVAVIAPHFSAAFVARDLGDTGPDMQRRFDFSITYERELCLRVAAAMIARIAPAPAATA